MTNISSSPCRWLRALAVGAALAAAGAAQAGDVRWSIGIGLPLPAFYPAPVYEPVPVYRPAPVYRVAPAPVYYEDRYPSRAYAPPVVVVRGGGYGHPRWVDQRWERRHDRRDWNDGDRGWHRDDRGERRYRHD